jgi:hypothetical protein
MLGVIPHPMSSQASREKREREEREARRKNVWAVGHIRLPKLTKKTILRRPGIEPRANAWKAFMLPLHHRRLFFALRYTFFDFYAKQDLFTNSHAPVYLNFYFSIELYAIMLWYVVKGSM